MIGAGILHPTRLEEMEGVLLPTEFEEDDREGEDVCPQLDVWEFADPGQELLRGRVGVGDAPLDITSAVYPERIQTQQRAEITNLDRRLVRPSEDEQVVCLQVPMQDAFVVEPPQPLTTCSPIHLMFFDA